MPRPAAHLAVAWLLNLLVPWTGHVLVGAVSGGAVVAVLWGGFVAASLLLYTIWPQAWEANRWWLLGPAVGIYFAGQLAFAIRTVELRRAGRTDRDTPFRRALEAYLDGRLDQTETICRELLKRDPEDVEAVLQLALVAKRRGRPGEAARGFRRVRYLDAEGRWDDLVHRELARLGAG